jgi:asparagine synthase (glutamine-hydrolysing)
VRTERYWKLQYTPKRVITADEACEELLARLREAVRLRLISDVPSAHFSAAASIRARSSRSMAEMGSGPVKTFSIGFDEKEYDELPYARMVARRYGTDHHEFIVRPMRRRSFRILSGITTKPFADSSAIPTYYLSQLTRQHVTVALNGDAGDENFAGYTRYLPARRLLRAFDRLPPFARHAAGSLAAALAVRRPIRSWLARGQRWLERARPAGR